MLPLVTSESITDFIPHRWPFVFVNSLDINESDLAISSFKVLAGTAFEEEGYFSEAGMLENIAQTVALKIGYDNREHKGVLRTGLIAIIKNVNVYGNPLVGQTIKTVVTVTSKLSHILAIRATTYQENDKLLTAEMNLFLEEAQNMN